MQFLLQRNWNCKIRLLILFFFPSLNIMRVNMNSNFRGEKKYPSVKDITFLLGKLILDYSYELLNSQTLGSGFCTFVSKLLQQKQQLHNVKNPLAFSTNQIKPNRFFSTCRLWIKHPHHTQVIVMPGFYIILPFLNIFSKMSSYPVYN